MQIEAKFLRRKSSNCSLVLSSWLIVDHDSNINSINRVYNSSIGFSDRNLIPLINPNTGEDIPFFPATAGCIRHMPIRAPDGMDLEQKRDQIRVAIGLRINPA